MEIQLLWIEGCPSYRLTEDLLERLLCDEQIDARIEMIQVRDQAEAVAQRFLGSPTVRINGVDPFAEADRGNYAMQCRLYPTANGLRGIPPEGTLRAALHEAKNGE